MRRFGRDIDIVDTDSPGIREHLARNRVEQGRLAGSVAADHDGKVSRPQRERYTVECGTPVRRALVKRLVQPIERKHGRDDGLHVRHSTTHLQSARAAGSGLPVCFSRRPLMTAVWSSAAGL